MMQVASRSVIPRAVRLPSKPAAIRSKAPTVKGVRVVAHHPGQRGGSTRAVSLGTVSHAIIHIANQCLWITPIYILPLRSNLSTLPCAGVLAPLPTCGFRSL